MRIIGFIEGSSLAKSPPPPCTLDSELEANKPDVKSALGAVVAALQSTSLPKAAPLRPLGLSLLRRLAAQAVAGDEAMEEALDAANVPPHWRDPDPAAVEAAAAALALKDAATPVRQR